MTALQRHGIQATVTRTRRDEFGDPVATTSWVLLNVVVAPGSTRTVDDSHSTRVETKPTLYLMSGAEVLPGDHIQAGDVDGEVIRVDGYMSPHTGRDHGMRVTLRTVNP